MRSILSKANAPNRNMRPSMKRRASTKILLSRTIVEDAKTEEKENENGEKETVEVSPAQRTDYKII